MHEAFLVLFKIKQISESELSIYSPFKFKINSTISIHSKELMGKIGLDGHFIQCRIASCLNEGQGYSIKAIIVGLSDQIATRIRSLTMKGDLAYENKSAIYR